MLGSVGSETPESLAEELALMQQNGTIRQVVTVDAEKILHGTLIDYVPVLVQLAEEFSVKGVLVDGLAVLVDLN